jgi:pimeloyl-ACP methyl ester carboxylesterase
MTESYQVQGIHVDYAAAQYQPGAEGSSRPSLLLVHGACHGAWCWENWLRVLPAWGWNVHALSLRNHPGSRPLEDSVFLRDLRVDDYARDVAAVAEHIVVPCVVVGHSMGGIVAQRYVAQATASGGRAAHSVAGLVLLASAPPGQLGPLREAPLPTERPYLPERETARRLFFHGSGPGVDAALDRLVGESPAVVNEYSLGVGVAIDPGQVRCPVLVVSAEHEGTVVPRDRRIADFYGADFHYAEGVGHDLMLDHGWQPVLTFVLGWIMGRVVAPTLVR